MTREEALTLKAAVELAVAVDQWITYEIDNKGLHEAWQKYHIFTENMKLDNWAETAIEKSK